MKKKNIESIYFRFLFFLGLVCNRWELGKGRGWRVGGVENNGCEAIFEKKNKFVICFSFEVIFIP